MTLDNEKLIHVREVSPPATALPPTGEGHTRTLDEYLNLYKQSIEDPATFFGQQARKHLSWATDFKTTIVPDVSFDQVPAWFEGGKLNASYNCVDRHAKEQPDKTALIYEGDEPNSGYSVTYSKLLEQVCQMAGLLTKVGVKQGDVVTVYLPMIPEAVVAMLACTRIGAQHSCVFAGFSPGALRDRIHDANSKVVITIDQSSRAGKILKTKSIVDEALDQCPDVHTCIVFERLGEKSRPGSFKPRDVRASEAGEMPKYVEPVWVDSEHPLFLLYTSGSTGKPKGIQHTTAGYLLGTLLTTKHILGVAASDILFCAGDVGWITGHSYGVYGPLLNGATSVIFESTPVYPSHVRYWQIVDEYKVTQFYVAPTALRLLRMYGAEEIERFSLKSLRTLGSVGEPIAEEVWEWFYNNVGRGRCALCDTYWLTESGSILVSSIPGVTPMKPGAAGFPFFGIDPVIIDPTSGTEITERPAEGVLAIRKPWPSMARTIHGDHPRFFQTYLDPYKGYFFPGDGAAMDANNYIFVSGRMDDVVNVSGHRLSTAEVEACLLEERRENKPVIVESAVVGIEDDITGQALVAFVVLEGWLRTELEAQKCTVQDLSQLTVQIVRKEIGPFAAPKRVYIVPDLPKTRSGKIMRRILRKIVSGEQDQLGELSTLSNPQVIEELIACVA